ncbi:MAG TPA: hypothetical protein GX507_08815 [Clostridia bacterium]|nr:hypothetical protein [Clostridia bacterium]
MKPEEYVLTTARVKQEIATMKKCLDRLAKYNLYPNIKAEKIGGFRLSDEEALRIVGSLLHDMYTSFENAAKAVAARIDKSMPSGPDWHKELITQLTLEVPGVRPAMISPKTAALIEPYRGFRHIFRNLYGFDLSSDKIKELIKGLPVLVDALMTDLTGFINCLEELAGLDTRNGENHS